MWRFGRASYLLLSDEQEARATIALAQSLLSGDTHYDDKSDVKVYYDVANRLIDGQRRSCPYTSS